MTYTMSQSDSGHGYRKLGCQLSRLCVIVSVYNTKNNFCLLLNSSKIFLMAGSLLHLYIHIIIPIIQFKWVLEICVNNSTKH